jgi:ribosomal protein L11 methyltransferase
LHQYLCTNINIRQGKISELKFAHQFDIVLANINRNILLDEIKNYVKELVPCGHLLLSGFYENDIDTLIKEALKFNLQEVHRDNRETWACLLLQKK